MVAAKNCMSDTSYGRVNKDNKEDFASKATAPLITRISRGVCEAQSQDFEHAVVGFELEFRDAAGSVHWQVLGYINK